MALVFIRMVAALFVLGLLFSSAQAHDLDLSPAPVALVDVVDDGEDLEVTVAAETALEEFRSAAALTAPDAPPGFSPCSSVFRPPRRYAFN